MSPGRALSIVIESLVLTIAIAVNEETMMRGYVLQTLKWGYGAVPALLITSIVFGSMHIFNPGASLAGVLGTGAAGLLLGYGYLATGRLWLSIGLHFGWNLALGPIFGFPVSGMNLESIVHQTVHGPRLWTGGSFGPEAGLLAISVIIVGAAVIRFFSRSSLYVKI
jgi:membrane protease YdiL (CAAX protease family)